MSDLKPAHEALSPEHAVIFGEARTVYHLEYRFPWSTVRESDWARGGANWDARTEEEAKAHLIVVRKEQPEFQWRAVRVTEIKELVKE